MIDITLGNRYTRAVRRCLTERKSMPGTYSLDTTKNLMGFVTHSVLLKKLDTFSIPEQRVLGTINELIAKGKRLDRYYVIEESAEGFIVNLEVVSARRLSRRKAELWMEHIQSLDAEEYESGKKYRDIVNQLFKDKGLTARTVPEWEKATEKSRIGDDDVIPMLMPMHAIRKAVSAYNYNSWGDLTQGNLVKEHHLKHAIITVLTALLSPEDLRAWRGEVLEPEGDSNE